jgi:Pyridoxamine 5'-phosphate oxidase
VPEPHMEELDEDECRKLLAERHLGRLAIPDFGGPMIFPVNCIFDQDLVVFRTDPGSKLDAATERESVAFEVDAVDEATRTGWSVVVRGTLADITDPTTWRGSGLCPCTPGPLAPRPGTCACGHAGSPAGVSRSPTGCPSPGGADRRLAACRRWAPPARWSLRPRHPPELVAVQRRSPSAGSAPSAAD